jgi:polysaccharide chain length determinant protein (PEP-CTERM system associated)
VGALLDQVQVIKDLFGILRRRAAILLLISAIGIAGAIGYARMQPSVYETSARILVESQQIPNDLARSTVNMSSAERLQLIEQRLTSRNYLISVIRELDLFSDAAALTINDKITLLREAIRVESILVSGSQSGDVEIFTFTITMRHHDAEQAADIVNTFVEAAVAENRRVRAERARDTRAHFEQQVERIADRIIEIEGEISTFKREHEGALPENLEFRRDELVRLQESSMEIERRLLELEDEHVAIELTLSGGSPIRSTELLPRSPEETELRRLTVELAQKRRRLAPAHPEVLLLQDQIAALAELVPSAATEAVAITGLSGEPTREQRSALRRQMGLLEQQIGLLGNQRERIDKRREALEESIRETPQVEVALNPLVRELSGLQDQHSALQQLYAQARTGEELETSEQSERFRVVEDALAPDHPVEPNRRKIVLFGSAASIGFAFALAFLLEMMNPAIRTSMQIERQLGLRPVVSIPYVRTRWERRRRRMAWATPLVLVALGGLVVPYALEEGDAMEMLEERLESLFGGADPGTVSETASDAAEPEPRTHSGRQH